MIDESFLGDYPGHRELMKTRMNGKGCIENNWKQNGRFVATCFHSAARLFPFRSAKSPNVERVKSSDRLKVPKRGR
jgi:hypothetical protein